jgi:hypothetical protein
MRQIILAGIAVTVSGNTVVAGSEALAVKFEAL